MLRPIAAEPGSVGNLNTKAHSNPQKDKLFVGVIGTLNNSSFLYFVMLVDLFSHIIQTENG